MSALRLTPDPVVRWLRRFLIACALLLFALLATSTVALFALQGVLSDPERVHTILDQVNFGERAYALSADVLLQSGGAEGAPFMGDYPPQTWRAVAQQLLPADWLGEHAHMLVDGTLTWLKNGTEPVPEFAADLDPVRQRLRGPDGAQIVLPLLQDRPLCSAEMGAGAFTVLQDDIISCLPPGANLNAVAAEVATALAARLPARLNFSETEEGMLYDAFLQGVRRLHTAWSVLESGLQLAFRLSLFIFVIYALLFASSPRRLLSALPWPFYSAGILSLLLLFAAQILVSFGMQSTVSGMFPRFGGEAQLLLVDLTGQIFNAGRLTWILLSLGLLFLAGAIHGSVYLWRRYRIAKEEQTRRPRRSRIRRQYR